MVIIDPGTGLPGSIYFFSGNRGPPSVIEARTRATGATLIRTAASVCDEHAHRRFTIAEIAQDCRDTTAAKELRDLLGKLDSAITNDDALFALIERHRESWKNIDNAPTDDGLEQAAGKLGLDTPRGMPRPNVDDA